MGMTLLLCYMLRNDAFDAVYFVPAESGLWNEEKKTMNQQPITSLKGIGEKTAKLFAKLGVETVEEQIDIAKRKAGISRDEEVRLERFEVVRHE